MNRAIILCLVSGCASGLPPNRDIETPEYSVPMSSNSRAAANPRPPAMKTEGDPTIQVDPSLEAELDEYDDEPPPPDRGGPLPSKPSLQHIRYVMSSRRAPVQSCLRELPYGSVVRLRLAVAGQTGRIVSMEVYESSEEIDEGMKRCLWSALSDAQFVRFEMERIGVVYPFYSPAPEPAPR